MITTGSSAQAIAMGRFAEGKKPVSEAVARTRDDFHGAAAFPAGLDIDKWDLHMLHYTAWQRGIKSLYYCRSKSIQRAGFAGKLDAARATCTDQGPTDYEECLPCQ